MNFLREVETMKQLSTGMTCSNIVRFHGISLTVGDKLCVCVRVRVCACVCKRAFCFAFSSRVARAGNQRWYWSCACLLCSRVFAKSQTSV
jgi:hypothetical protein